MNSFGWTPFTAPQLWTALASAAVLLLCCSTLSETQQPVTSPYELLVGGEKQRNYSMGQASPTNDPRQDQIPRLRLWAALQNAKYRSVVLSVSLLVMQQGFYNCLLTLWVHTQASEGGLNLSTRTFSLFLSGQALSHILMQVPIFPRLLKRFGHVKCLRGCGSLHPLKSLLMMGLSGIVMNPSKASRCHLVVGMMTCIGLLNTFAGWSPGNLSVLTNAMDIN